MPLYEYTCLKCAKRFEALVFGREKPSCPKCHGADLEKMFSTFAAHGTGKGGDSFGSDFGDGGDGGGDDVDASGAGGGCGSCGDPRGPGSCAVN
jgi:putative FmdB family regulatory protein